MDIWQNQSPLFCCSVKKQCIFVDLLQIKGTFHCQESISIHGVSAYERAQTKEKSNFHFQMCPRPLTRVCPLTGMYKYRV